MPIDFTLHQLLLEGSAVRARTSQVPHEWETLLDSIRERWNYTGPDEALFALPFGLAHVVVGRGRGNKLHGLILGRELYGHLHDPFAIAERYPVYWDARGSLPDSDWPAEPLPRRKVEELNEMCRQGDGPFLFAAAQTLVDGGKIVLCRPTPEPQLLRQTWALLPDSERRTHWPATFAANNELGFDMVVLPVLPEIPTPGCLSEDQVREYPDSRYERHLQIAIEECDQKSLDHQFARKTTGEMIRLALWLIVIGLVLLFLLRFLPAIIR